MTREELLKIIEHAKHSHVLNLSGSQLSELPPEIGELTHLTRLSLKHNTLKNLPKEIGNLTSLRELWLDDNQLTGLPTEIGEMRNLKWLSATNNRLQSLPEELAELKHLEILELSGNPELPLPQENASARPAELIDYVLMQLEKRFINEAKLMVLGKPGVGKTSLIRRMIDRVFDPAEKPSRGISIQRWPQQVGFKRMQLSIWDFGHDETRLNLHRLFMTPNTLYLLVWDAGEENHAAEFENWLKLIEYLGDRSPVIVVLSRIDRGVKELNRQQLQRQFPQIREFINCSASEGAGIHQLRDAIKRALPEMSGMRTPWEPGWLNVKTRLEISRRDYMERSEYDQLCDREGLDASGREKLLGWLRDIGIIVNFPEDLRLSHLLIQQPGWLANGILQTLSLKSAFSTPGILFAGDVQQVFRRMGYSRAHLPYFIDLMKKFELCFDVDDGADRKYLVPQWLPAARPKTDEAYRSGLHFQYAYGFLPNDLVTKVAARIYPFIIPETLWQGGFEVKDRHNRALVEMNVYENAINISVKGRQSTRRDFLAFVRSHFEFLHALYPMIELVERVPLTDQPEIRLDYQHLLKLEEIGEESIFPEGVGEPLRISTLLNGADVSPRNRQQHARHLEQRFSELNSRIERFWLAYARERNEKKQAEIEADIFTCEAERDHLLGELAKTTRATAQV